MPQANAIVAAAVAQHMKAAKVRDTGISACADTSVTAHPLDGGNPKVLRLLAKAEGLR